MNLQDHKIYNSPNRIADLLIAADKMNDMRNACALLGQDGFNVLEIGCVTGAYKDLRDALPLGEEVNRNLLIRAIRDIHERQARAPYRRPLTAPHMMRVPRNLSEQAQQAQSA